MTTQATTQPATTTEPEPETVTPSENRVIVRRESDGYEADIPAAALSEERFAGCAIVSKADGSPYEGTPSGQGTAGEPEAPSQASSQAPTPPPPPPPPPPPAPAGDA